MKMVLNGRIEGANGSERQGRRSARRTRLKGADESAKPPEEREGFERSELSEGEEPVRAGCLSALLARAHRLVGYWLMRA